MCSNILYILILIYIIFIELATLEFRVVTLFDFVSNVNSTLQLMRDKIHGMKLFAEV